MLLYDNVLLLCSCSLVGGQSYDCFSAGEVWMTWVNSLGTYLATYRTRHYGDVIMGTITSQITSLNIVYSTVYSVADQRKHQRSASQAFVWGIHWGLVNSLHKWPVMRKMFPFDDVIMGYSQTLLPFWEGNLHLLMADELFFFSEYPVVQGLNL